MVCTAEMVKGRGNGGCWAIQPSAATPAHMPQDRSGKAGWCRAERVASTMLDVQRNVWYIFVKICTT